MNEGLFRKTAIEHYLRGEEGGAPLRVSPPWTWTLFWILAGVLAVALAASFFGKVEVTGRGRGILRPLPGIQVLTTQVSGTVGQINLSSGQSVRTGDPVLRLDSAALQAQLLEAERQLQLLQSNFQAFAARQDRFYGDQEGTLKTRLLMLRDQDASLKESVVLANRKLEAQKTLRREKLVSDFEVDAAREGVAQAERQLGSSRQAQVQTQQELAALHARREEDLWRREQELQQARTKRDALQFSLQQAVITAPMDGVLEAILVKPGDVIQPGQPVGRIVPKGAPMRVVAFLPEKDRAFVKVGDEARLELDQLPYAEFGSLRATVLRVSGDLATAQDYQEAMGDAMKGEGAAYRVELELKDGEAGRLAKGGSLRTGMLMNVRFTLRRQKPISMILDPLKRWLD